MSLSSITERVYESSTRVDLINAVEAVTEIIERSSDLEIESKESFFKFKVKMYRDIKRKMEPKLYIYRSGVKDPIYEEKDLMRIRIKRRCLAELYPDSEFSIQDSKGNHYN